MSDDRVEIDDPLRDWSNRSPLQVLQEELDVAKLNVENLESQIEGLKSRLEDATVKASRGRERIADIEAAIEKLKA